MILRIGLIRRLVIMPLNAKITPKTPGYDPNIKEKLNNKECLEYILYKSIQGINNVIKNKNFTETLDVKQALKDYELYNNPVAQFLEDRSITEITCQEVYLFYQVWCKENGHQPLSQTKFGVEIKKLNYKVVQRKNNRKTLL